MQDDDQVNEAAADLEARDLCELADRYRVAAAILDQFGDRGALQAAPFRLTALHAIDLYLNALLRKHGHTMSEIKALLHSSGKKLEQAAKKGFKLDKKTAQHLAELERGREYLVSRYHPEQVKSCSPSNRVSATLRKVGDEVRKALAA